MRTSRDVRGPASEGGDHTVAVCSTKASAGPKIDSYTLVAREVETRVSARDRSAFGGDARLRRLGGDAGRTATQGGKNVDAGAWKGMRMADGEPTAVGERGVPFR